MRVCEYTHAKGWGFGVVARLGPVSCRPVLEEAAQSSSRRQHWNETCHVVEVNADPRRHGWISVSESSGDAGQVKVEDR